MINQHTSTSQQSAIYSPSSCDSKAAALLLAFSTAAGKSTQIIARVFPYSKYIIGSSSNSIISHGLAMVPF